MEWPLVGQLEMCLSDLSTIMLIVVFRAAVGVVVEVVDGVVVVVAFKGLELCLGSLCCVQYDSWSSGWSCS